MHVYRLYHHTAWRDQQLNINILCLVIFKPITVIMIGAGVISQCNVHVWLTVHILCDVLYDLKFKSWPG